MQAEHIFARVLCDAALKLLDHDADAAREFLRTTREQLDAVAEAPRVPDPPPSRDTDSDELNPLERRRAKARARMARRRAASSNGHAPACAYPGVPLCGTEQMGREHVRVFARTNANKCEHVRTMFAPSGLARRPDLISFSFTSNVLEGGERARTPANKLRTSANMFASRPFSDAQGRDREENPPPGGLKISREEEPERERPPPSGTPHSELAAWLLLRGLPLEHPELAKFLDVRRLARPVPCAEWPACWRLFLLEEEERAKHGGRYGRGPSVRATSPAPEPITAIRERERARDAEHDRLKREAVRVAPVGQLLAALGGKRART